MSRIRRSVTDSGIRVVTERMPESHSATLGVWVGVGSRDESEAQAGVSHFLEHLLFKGTETRTARQISQQVEARGGWFNAYTSREHTEFELKVPAGELSFALDLLTDIVAEPALRVDELEAERQVILEEIAMNADDPDETVNMLLLDALFPGHPMGRETLGSIETVEALSRSDIVEFHARHYGGSNVVVAAVGLVDHDMITERLDGWLATRALAAPAEREAPPDSSAELVEQHRDTEQAHIAMAWRALAQDHPDRFALAVANHTLGGGASSRLFEEVREQRGLAYSVGSGVSLFSDTGMLTVGLGTSVRRAPDALAVVDEVIESLHDEGPDEAEMEVAVGYLCGSLLLSGEDTGARMSRLGSAEVAGMPLLSVEDLVERVREVTLDEVRRVLGEVLAGPRTVAMVGPGKL